MNQIIAQESIALTYLRERRKNDRYQELNLLVITTRGTGKILDINHNGLSFGCLYHHSFPEIWPMDIIDAKGIHLKQLMVRKIWERNSGHPDLLGSFELEIGVEFTTLTPLQENVLDLLLDTLPGVEIQTPCYL